MCLCLYAYAADAAKPLKVYILAGQSNMEGHARVETFDYIADDPATAPMLKEMRGPGGKPRICDKVWISYFTGWETFGEGFGKLTAGYGARDNPAENGGKIGPEFTFGIYMEKATDVPILIIKTAWGGKSLNTDFRSPSAGPYQFDEQQLEILKKQGQDIEKIRADKAEATGRYYRMMMDHVKMVLKDIKRVCPVYDEKEGYELAGFVWFQGWNDMCDGQTYPNSDKPGGYDLYSELMAHFIRDVRKDLSAPKMPFVIGVIGVDGDKATGGLANIRPAMAAPAEMPEFKGNVIAVETAPFWDYAMAAAQPKQEEYNQIVDTAHTLNKDGTIDKGSKWETFWKPIGKPLPEDRTWRFISIDPREKKDKLGEYADRRFRDITLPAGMEQWYMPGFDDSQWMEGKAPIGKGDWKHSGITLDKHRSNWGEGEFLLMRTTFEVDELNYEAYRIAILARQGFNIYLNGHKIHTYIWWNDKPYYRSIILGNEEIQYLKKGVNVLAAYANDQYGRGSTEHYAAIDLWVEGITQPDREKLDRQLEEILPLKDREILKGASNGDYHYMGSAKIMAQIGKAFAEAMLELMKQPKPAVSVQETKRFASKCLELRIGDVQGFVILPLEAAADGSKPWVWYAPSYWHGYPNERLTWLFSRLLKQGFYVCGTNVGDSFGSPQSRNIYSRFYEHVVKKYGLSPKVCLLPQSRGGLMWYNWAVENPQKVACIGGIYPVCDLTSYPGLGATAGAYGMTEAELNAQLTQHNPIERLAPLAKAKVPILHLHGDKDDVVPLEKNSGELVKRYRVLDGPGELVLIAGQGHAEIPEYFESEKLLEFFLKHGKATPPPSRR